MDSSLRKSLNGPSGTVPSRPATDRWISGQARYRVFRLAELLGPVVVGLALGVVVVFTTTLPSTWAGLVLLATLIPTVVLLAGKLKRVLLVVLVVDIVLGLDFSLGNRPDHRGGPGGLVVSLMTFALVVAYVHWLRSRPVPGKAKSYVPAGIAIPAVLYLFAGLVSVWQATEPWFSISEFFLQAQFLLMFFFVVVFVDAWADVRLVASTLVVCLLVEGTIMLLQYYGGIEWSVFGVATDSVRSDIASASIRVAGTFPGPNLAATYLSATLCIALAAYLTGNRLTNRWLAAVAFLVGIVALLLTQSRSGWIAFAIAMAILLTVAAWKHVNTKAIWRLLIVSAVLLIGFSAIVTERFSAEDRGSGESRIYHSRMAIDIIDDYLFTGVGLNNQRYTILSGEYTPLELWGKEEEIQAIHNSWLATWVEIGLFGFLALVWLLMATSGRALLAVVRTKDRYTSVAIAGLLAALVVPMVHMLTATFTGRRMQFVWFLIALIAATVRIAKQTDGMKDPMRQAEHREETGPAPSLATRLSLPGD